MAHSLPIREPNSAPAGTILKMTGTTNPGFIMNALALFREKEFPEEDEIREYLAGNLCRCSGYEGQLRGILAFLDWKREKQKEAAE